MSGRTDAAGDMVEGEASPPTQEEGDSVIRTSLKLLNKVMFLAAWIRSRAAASKAKGLLMLTFLAMLLAEACSTGGMRRFLTWEPDTRRPLSDVSDPNGPFRASLQRRYSSELENRLLAIVEATYPLYPRSLILPGFETPTGNEQPKWWLSSADGIQIPVGITRGSVEYFLGLIESFRKGDFSGSNGITQVKASLEYSAQIEPARTALEDAGDQDRLEDIFIVHMELEWSSDCGTRCGLRFTRTRIAVVHQSGKVLEILEDPLPPALLE